MTWWARFWRWFFGLFTDEPTEGGERVNGIAPRAYRKLADDIEDLMVTARSLGLYRTAERLHGALNEARSETFEAMPRDDVTIEWTIGPVREQPIKP